MTIKPIPEGYRTVTPYLITSDVSGLIEFLHKAFKAEVIIQMNAPDGGIMHAEVEIGDSKVMMGEADEEYPPMPAMLYLYVENVDEVYQQTLQAGAESIQPPKDQFHGDRTANVKDPFGNLWGIATHIENVSPEEMARRMEG